MNSRCVRILAAIIVVLLFAFSALAQQENKKQWKAASFDGTTGLFKVWDAETLRQWETNWTVGYDRFARDPGYLKVGRLPVGVAIGILDRFEFFASMDIQRHISEEYLQTNRLWPGMLPIPANTITGVQTFSQVAPFMDVPDATGRSDVHLGVKFNLLSERRGNALSMALAGFGTLPGQRTATGLNRGLSNGAFAGGFSLLFSKNAADFARIHFNIGSNYVANPDIQGVELADLQHEFLYKAGIELPAYKAARIIAELNGTKYYGTGSDGLNPKSPLDLIFGVRYYPREWLSFAGGYQISFHQDPKPTDTGTLEFGYDGFVIQGAVGTRRNDPPTVSCVVAKPSILQGDTTTVRANAVDPDGDRLTYSWSASGGAVDGQDDTATFNAANIAPGRYTVTATVSDKKYQATCSSDITVLKRNVAPTVSLEPGTFDITQGESVSFSCKATDGNNDPLTYSWTVNGQRLAAEGPQITFGSEGRDPGAYEVQCSASDGEASASAASKGTIRQRIAPNRPPTIDCLTTTMDVASGGSIELRAKAADPDGDRLNYSWSSTGGTVSGAGETATFNAAGVKAGSYAVTVTVDDGKGGKASCSMTVNVSERLSITKENCGFFAAGGTRVDNCAKAILDDLAVRMKNDPKLRANVIGYTDDSRLETRRKGLGEKRARAVAAYLEKQGVEASRLSITDGAANNPVGDNKTAAGRKLNRRVEIELTVH
ncbi:MAG: PKD domain-containing protein [Acidobacteria bacterium]|nr:PKD domain-containing protein [Acidobacteriota bacterium]